MCVHILQVFAHCGVYKAWARFESLASIGSSALLVLKLLCCFLASNVVLGDSPQFPPEQCTGMHTHTTRTLTQRSVQSKVSSIVHTLCKDTYTQGWPEPYIHTVYDCMYGDFPAKNTVYIPYIPINVWFWPTLHIPHLEAACVLCT